MASVESRSFLPGEKVALFKRTGGGPLAAGSRPLAAAKKVGSDGTVRFDGLDEGLTVYVAREDGSSAIAMTAKTAPAPRRRQSEKAISEQLAGTIWQDPNRTVVSGARNTASRGGAGQPFVNPETGSATPSELGVEPGHPRQEDYRHVPQRSATVTGRAEPVMGAPQAEGVPNRDAHKIEQASATEHGHAVPRDPAADPAERARQEDAARNARQRAVAPTGEQTPVDDPPARTKSASRGSGQRTSRSSAGSRTTSRSRASRPNQSGKARAPKRPAKEGKAAKSAARTKSSRSSGRSGKNNSRSSGRKK